MILIPFNHADRAVQVSFFPFRIIAQCFIWIIPHAVRLDICLIHYIQPVFITKLVPSWDVRIMACSDCVYVESFHQLDIFHHVFFRDNSAGFRFVLMTVNALNHDWHAINE